jgi:hypothetical protein
MLQFLQAFERRSWSRDPEIPFLVPFSKDDLREPHFSSTIESPR